MTYKDFENLLKKIDINKKEFAKLTELSYQTVMNWNNTNNVPKWVKSWLENYIEAKSYQSVRDNILEIEKIKNPQEPFALFKKVFGEDFEIKK